MAMSRLRHKFLNRNACKLCHLQRPTAQRDGGGKFEKGNLVNGNVWQRDEDQLTEGGERFTQLTIQLC